MNNEAVGKNVRPRFDFHSLAIVSLYEMESSGRTGQGGVSSWRDVGHEREDLDDFGYADPSRFTTHGLLKTRSIPRLSSTRELDMTIEPHYSVTFVDARDANLYRRAEPHLGVLKGKRPMLVLTRKLMEKLFIGDDICVTVVRLEGGQVRLGIDAPREVAVVRAELVPDRQAPRFRSVRHT